MTIPLGAVAGCLFEILLQGELQVTLPSLSLFGEKAVSE